MGYDARPGSIHVIFNGGTDDMDHASQLQPVSLARDLSKGLLEGKEISCSDAQQHNVLKVRL